MTSISKNDYVASIEESASFISSEAGSEVVQSVYQLYGAKCLDDVKDSDLPDVFSEIYAIEADLK